MFGYLCYILNQRYQRSKFEAKANEVVFQGYTSVSKAFRVINLSRKTVKETAHVIFDEVSFFHDWIDHPSSIMNELTYSPSDIVLYLLPRNTELVVHNVNQIISSQPISKDQPIISKQVEPSNQ